MQIDETARLRTDERRKDETTRIRKYEKPNYEKSVVGIILNPKPERGHPALELPGTHQYPNQGITVSSVSDIVSKLTAPEPLESAVEASCPRSRGRRPHRSTPDTAGPASQRPPPQSVRRIPACTGPLRVRSHLPYRPVRPADIPHCRSPVPVPSSARTETDA